MTIVPVTHQKEVKAPHVMYIHETPESAAIQYEQRFGVLPETIYTHGQRVYIPLDGPALDRFWQTMDNKV